MTDGAPATQLSYEEMFVRATGAAPFPYQEAFAVQLPALVNVPTGLGKTAMAVLGWLWQRRFEPESRRLTPRRLVYCLPMRVLVEQTRDNAVKWLYELRVLAGKAEFEERDGERNLRAYTPDHVDPAKIAVHVLMGGAEKDDWDVHPERDAIIIGTQDMLLSRALNRGYGASRARWPMHFGLLHTDCLWVFDEIQLMGSGLATTAQLEAFRRLLSRNESPQAKDGDGCRSVWMSATMRPEWLSTVDFKSRIEALPRLKLEEADHKNNEISKRWSATKPLTPAATKIGDAAALAKEINDAHKPGTRTIVVVNTVERACELYEKIAAHSSGDTPARGKKARAGRKGSAVLDTGPTPPAASPKIVLLHSRFRPDDRQRAVEAALAPPAKAGTIVVSTQVIEAGVDMSAATLFTELAPWASLVQRFGRCNRRGEENEQAAVRWIDLPMKDADAERLRFPYELPDLRAAAEQLKKLTDVGLGSLSSHRANLSEEEVEALFPHAHTHVLRRKDLIDLFDTTPDLAGNDIDIDRYVREIDETDVRVFWREWGGDAPPDDEPQPTREELCPAPIGEFRDCFVEEHPDLIWRWNFLDGTWEKVDAAKIAPGQVFLIHADAGGYSAECGWDAKSAVRVEPIPRVPTGPNHTPEATDEDAPSQIGMWQTIAQHTDEVCRELDSILKLVEMSDREQAGLRAAARWHDWGKAHRTFQDAVKAADRPVDMAASRFVAKAPGSRKDQTGAIVEAGFWTRYARKHFRHELASALAVLQKTVPLADADRDLVAYLIAAHHGKVRLSIRSLPNELRPRDNDGKPLPTCRFARGVWDGDVLSEADLGGGVKAPAVTLSLEPMELGLCEQPPFAGQPSWAERMIRLRDTLGPFRLAYLEAILRAADMRASKAADQPAATGQPVGSGADAKEADHG